MHRLILAILVLCVATFVVQRAEPQSCSVDFCDDFTTTPYSSLTSLQRWCERFHHIHYNASLGTMDVPRTGDGTSSDCTTGGGTTFLSCTSPPPGCACSGSNSECSSTGGGGGFFVVTKTSPNAGNYPGTTRQSEIDFGLRGHLPSGVGSHVATYVVTHPNCHTGVQAGLFVENASTGSYSLRIQVQNDSFTSTFPECDGIPTTQFFYALINPDGPDSFVNRKLATLTTIPANGPPNYRLVVNSHLDQNNHLVGRARLYSLSDLVTPLLDTSPKTFMGSVSHWYNLHNKGQRFGFGGGPLNPSQDLNLLRFDRFRGDGC